MEDLAERIVAGDLRALAQGATAVENRTPQAEALLKELFPHTGRAITIGITGPPGVGKSTLVNQFARTLRDRGKTVAIIAVDPSSPYTGGAILGDRVRMQEHHGDGGVFIRSMATRGGLGGLAPATSDMALLMDAAGRDTVLVETVGVGQDEVDIARLADVTAVIQAPGMGDDVQAIKAGIMEIADVFLINKADHPGAAKLESEIEAVIGLAAVRERPPVRKVVASEGIGIVEALDAILAKVNSNSRRERAVASWKVRLREMFRERLTDRLPVGELDRAAADVATRQRDPYSIVNDWLKRI